VAGRSDIVVLELETVRVLDIIRKNIFFGIIDFFFCILEMHV
jgi:hypothetical protein